jgi:arylsulfatase A-like enzyme
LRGHKASTWEGGVRVPFLLQWKGHLPAGKVYAQPVIQLDFAATALAAAGVEFKEQTDSVNLLPYLTGKKKDAPHEALYWRFGDQMAIRKGDWKLVKGRDNPAPEKPLLINLAKDIGEQKDLSEKEPKKYKELQAAWDAWNAELMAPQWKQGQRPRRPNRANRAN